MDGTNDGTSGTGDDGGSTGIVPDAQKSSAGETPAALDLKAGEAVGTAPLTSQAVASGSADSGVTDLPADGAAMNAGLDPNGNLAYSGLDKQGQFRIADKLTIQVEGDALRLRVAGLGTVKVDEFDFYDVVEKAFFSDTVKPATADI